MTPEWGRPLPGQASGHLLLTPEPQGQLGTASHCRQAARPHSEVFWNGGRQSSLTESQEAQGFPHSNVCCSGLGAGRLPQGQNQPRGFQPIFGEHPRVWKEHQAEKGHRLLGSLCFSFVKEGLGPSPPWEAQLAHPIPVVCPEGRSHSSGWW